VKICGLTRAEDVIAARELGVWAVGLVFAPSARRVEPAAALRLLEDAGWGGRPTRASAAAGDEDARAGRGAKGRRGLTPSDRLPLTVGVFTDADTGQIAQVVEEVGLDAVQLHGKDGTSAAAVGAALGGDRRVTLIIQAVPVDVEECDGERLREAVARARQQADIVLLDTRVKSGPAEMSTRGAVGAVAAKDSAIFGGSGRSFSWSLAREFAGLGEAPLLVAGGVDPDNALTALSESGAWGIDVSSGVEAAPGVKDAMLMERLVARVREGIQK
jgi:phosphoribosylanthranilate isomerase